MVFASTELLSNSGDDQKSLEVVIKTSTPASSSVTLNIDQTTKANIANADILEANLMSTKKVTETSGSDRTTAEEEGILTTEAPLSPEAPTAIDNANQNEEVPLTFPDQQQELSEQQISFSNILKAMASNNQNSSEYTINESTTFQSDLGTARPTIPTTGSVIEKNDDGEIENNNHAYATALIDATFNNMIAKTEINSDTTDTNINMMNIDSTVKSLNTLTPETDENISGMLNNADRSSYFNTLTIGGNITKANMPQTINMNNANINVNNVATTSSMSTNNKPVNPVYALDATRTTPILNALNNCNNKNSHIINGDAGAANTATTINGPAKIILYCEQSSHPFQTRTILLTPNIECKVGRLIAKCKASESNAIFDCKVLSRNHAVLWYSDDGKFWVKDTKSSNGTFINDNKLGNDAAELHYGDVVKFGVDVLENSRKEVHGCIIASVKLYLPDGRQAISVDSNNSQRSQYSGESRISFDDLHRLNVYMQETSQREKALKSKLYNIQNLLDATRKNSSTCWQAMISEDQLLHRIHSLEKKIQILEKNMPENALKNEIMKLVDDKTAYQQSAKEALRSVYLERCETLQKMTQLESELAASENERKILQDQIPRAEEALQEVNDRIRLLENEDNKFRSEMELQQMEAKAEFEERIKELNEKLQQREEECKSLRAQISEMSQPKRTTDSNGEVVEENLQKQAIEKLDAVIAGMDIGDDDDEEEDDDDDEEDDPVDEDVAMAVMHLRQQKQNRINSRDIYEFNGSSGSSGNEKGDSNPDEKSEKKFAGGEATIMKWLKNSDLNTKEGSIDIFNAICNNESDSSDEEDGSSYSSGGYAVTGKELKQSCTKLEKKLLNIRRYILQLELDIKDNPIDDPKTIKDESYDDEEIKSKLPETALQSQEKLENNRTKNDEYNTQLRKTVYTLHEAFEEIYDNFKILRVAVAQKQKQKQKQPKRAIAGNETKFEKLKNITAKSSSNSSNIMNSLPEINEVEEHEHDSEEDYDNNDNDMIPRRTSGRIEAEKPKNTADNIYTGASFVVEIEELKAKLHERDRESQQMLDMLQIECETHKTKVHELLQLTEKLRREQETDVQQQQMADELSSNAIRSAIIINEDVSGDGVSSDSGVSSVDKTTETTAAQFVADASVNTSTTSEGISEIESTATSAAAATAASATAMPAAVFEQQMIEDLEAISNTAIQQEEELIAYKETLERTLVENLKLRNDLLLIRQQQQPEVIINTTALMRTAIPMGIAVIGVLTYLAITYF